MLLQISIAAILIVVAIVYFVIVRPQKLLYDVFRAQGIPGEPFIPIIGQLPLIRKYRKTDQIMDFQKYLFKKHGPVCLFGFGPTTRILMSEPDLLADMFNRTNGSYYSKAFMTKAVFVPLVGEHNLLVSEGKEHERSRRMINPAFYHQNLKSMISIFIDQTIKTIDKLLQAPTANQQGYAKVDLQIQLNKLTLSIIASSAFGSSFETIEQAKDTICNVFGEVLDATIHRTLLLINQIPVISKLPFWKKDVVDNGVRLITELVNKIIADRRQGLSSSMSDGPDLLDLLLSAVDDNGKPFTDQEIKEQALTFVLAGSDTTGNLMTWMFYILMTHNDVYEACREEVDRVLPNDAELTNEKLNELVVCEAIINETLRLYPPAPLFTRYCIREHVIGRERQLRIPVGTTINISGYNLHRRNDLWPNAEQFDYTRWLRDPKTGLKPKLPHPFAFIPFAAGPRNCIGQNFALLEAKAILPILIQRCNFEIVPGQKIVEDIKITMRPKFGLWAKVSRRK